ncbi:MAG: ribonuclease HI [Acidobacteria bacterium]|nr:ribonuclease HI [Acidobacteriota bacterium]MCY3964276.1 ribonuclease HI [Acidobacteriota bacterium]
MTPAGTVERSGGAEETTANRLELECVLELLGALPPGQAAAVYTGNDYLRRGAALWIHAWKRNRWRTKSGGPVKNAELWHRLDRQLEERRVQWPAPTGDAGERLKELKERVRGLF